MSAHDCDSCGSNPHADNCSRSAFDWLNKKLLEVDEKGNYLDPLIGPTEEVIELRWPTYHVLLLPNGTWKIEAFDVVTQMLLIGAP